MSTHNITVKAGESKRLQTAGKYCDRDIIVTGDATLQSKTVSPSTSVQTVTPDSGYDGLSQVTVDAMPTAALTNPLISVSEYGVISSTVAITQAGYVSRGASASNTYNLSTQQGRTITPATVEKTAVAKGKFTLNDVTVAGDANLVDANIKKDVTIFGVTGSYEGEGGGINVTLPTRTVTVIDNDGAGDIVITALVNEGGKLIYKSTNMPSSGSVTITYAWYTPIFITSKYAASVSVYDAEGDLIQYCPNKYDATNKTFAVFPQSDDGDNHEVYVFQ